MRRSRLNLKLFEFSTSHQISLHVRSPDPGPVSAPKVRLTAVIMDVLDVITSSPSDNPAWGLRVCEATGYGTGTIYPALDRLMKAGWITDHWEDPPPPDRPRRRFYEITSSGRERYAEALRSHRQRRAEWLRPISDTGAARSRRDQFPWLLVGVLTIALAVFGPLGLVLAGAVLLLPYLLVKLLPSYRQKVIQRLSGRVGRAVV